MAVFYDTHAHLGFDAFDGDLPEVVARAHEAAITKIVTIGTDDATNRKAITIAEKFPNVFAAVGWHPNDLDEAPVDVRQGLRELAKHPKVAAIGETGLDFFRTARDKRSEAAAKQGAIFQQQLELAAELGLGCIIHTRDSFDETMEVMQPFVGKIRAVFHCFSQDVKAMERVFEAGWLVSFTGILTFKNAQTVRDCLASAPIDRFMFETDCPFLAPVPHRGARCEPAYVKHTAEAAALVRNCSVEGLSAATNATAEKFFPKLKAH